MAEEPLKSATYQAQIKQYLEKPVCFYPSLVKLTGSIEAALFLSQAVYWSDRSTLDDGWFYKTRSEWEAETCLSFHIQRRVRADLQKIGILSEKLSGVPATTHYKVEITKLKSFLDGTEQPPVVEPIHNKPLNPSSLKNLTSSCRTNPQQAVEPFDHLPSNHSTTITENTREYTETTTQEGASSAPVGSRKRSPKATTPRPAKPRKRDELFDYFASQYELARGFKYRVLGGDFVQLNKLRQAHSADGDEIEIADWRRAVANYLASSRTKESLRDLASQYNVFLVSVRDKYGNAIKQEGSDNVRKSFAEQRDDRIMEAWVESRKRTESSRQGGFDSGSTALRLGDGGSDPAREGVSD